jgi:hypothetical protein
VSGPSGPVLLNFCERVDAASNLGVPIQRSIADGNCALLTLFTNRSYGSTLQWVPVIVIRVTRHLDKCVHKEIKKGSERRILTAIMVLCDHDFLWNRMVILGVRGNAVTSWRRT